MVWSLGWESIQDKYAFILKWTCTYTPTPTCECIQAQNTHNLAFSIGVFQDTSKGYHFPQDKCSVCMKQRKNWENTIIAYKQ